MEAESPLQSLPRREYGQKVNLRNKVVVTNFFDIKFNRKNNVVYQFMFDTEPQIPQDSKDLLWHVVKSIKKELKEKVDFVTASGLLIWGSKNLSIPLSIKTAFKYQEKEFKFDVIIKPTKILEIDSLLKTKDGIAMVMQLWNNKIKGVLRDSKMDEVTQGKYFNKKEVNVEHVGLSILRGFKLTLSVLKEKSVALQIDVCSKVFRSHNLLEDINRLSKDAVEGLVGSTVITRYGKIKTYRIERIDFTQTPKSSFFHQKKAGKITFAQYFQDAYGLKVTQWNQPLIEVVSRVEKRKNKEGKIQKFEEKVFLIPEFVALTGMSDEQKSNYQTMSAIAPQTKFTPDQRLAITKELISKINGKEFQVEWPKNVTGYQLDNPTVRLSSDKNVVRAKDGSLNFRDKVKQSMEFKDWVVVYSQGKNAKADDGQADNFVELIFDAAKSYFIKFSDAGFITCDSNIKSWKTEIEKDIAKNGKPQILVLLMSPFEEKFYGELKQYITCQLNLPCQGVRKRTVKGKKAMSAATKIIIQMNQKIGGVAWEVISNEYFQKRKCMHGAFSISRGKKGFTLAFVGTLNAANTKVFTHCKVGYPRKEDIPAADFYGIFFNWAKTYVGENKEGPNMIMVYREGLSLPQVDVQVKQELAALQSVILKIAEKTKKPNYKPEVLYLIVNTKINTRIFDTAQSRGSQGKFMPRVFNPASGTVVFDQISTDKLFDFHLTAQRVTQGTCTPTHYILVSSNSNIPQESLAQFTYDQCFNYPNWQGAVKVPAVLQCANKLSKLVGESIQRSVTEGDIAKSYYFL